MRGPDVRRFCNGMFSNNARDLPVGDSQRTAMLDDRGRVLGLLDVHCVADDHMVAVLEGVTATDFCDRYAMYVVLDDVELEPLTHQVWHCPGDRPDVTGVLVAPRERGAGPGWDVVGEARSLADLPRSSGGWPELEAHRVAACLPRYPVDFSLKQLPHEMNMREAFLHFEKGCYVGQETVNRVDVMGGVRRRLVGLSCESLPSGDAEVRDIDGKVVGRVTSPTRHPSLGALALCVIRKPHDEPGCRVLIGTLEGTIRATVR